MNFNFSRNYKHIYKYINKYVKIRILIVGVCDFFKFKSISILNITTNNLI